MFFLSLLLIRSTILHGESVELSLMYIANITVYLIGVFLSWVYRICFDRIDVHKKGELAVAKAEEDEEEAPKKSVG